MQTNNISFEIQQEITVQSYERIKNTINEILKTKFQELYFHLSAQFQFKCIQFSSNSQILLISKLRNHPGICDLGIYQFKNGTIKQISRLHHNLRVIYCTRQSNTFISEYKITDPRFYKIWTFIGLNNTKNKSRIRITGQKVCCAINNAESLIVHSQDVARNYKYPKTQELIFYQLSKGGWLKIFIFYQKFYFENLIFKKSTSDLICCCSYNNQLKYCIKILHTQDELIWSVKQTINIPAGFNNLYNISDNMLASFDKYCNELNIYQKQDKNGQFKKCNTIKIMQRMMNNSSGSLYFHNDSSLLIAYNVNSIIYFDIINLNTLSVYSKIDLSQQQYCSGCCALNQDTNYLVSYFWEQQKIKIFKIIYFN